MVNEVLLLKDHTYNMSRKVISNRIAFIFAIKLCFFLAE